VWGSELTGAPYLPAEGSRTLKLGPILGSGLPGLWGWRKVSLRLGFPLGSVLLSQQLNTCLCGSVYTQAIEGCLELNPASPLLLTKVQTNHQWRGGF